MGYHAYGAGDAVLKKGANEEEVTKVVEEIIDKECLYMEFDFFTMRSPEGEVKHIDFWENDDHWYEEDTYKFLDALIPYITEGSAEYSGDEDCLWRYRLVDGKWIEEHGTTYYSDEDMIKYLESKGYTVTKEAA